jgi:pteridine reductase
MTTPVVPVVLVTGAARRIGAEIARHIHQRGARVMLHCRTSGADIEALAADLNGIRPESADIFQADLRDGDALVAMVAATRKRFGSLHALVNNASSFMPTPIGEIGEAEWNDLVGSNFKGPLLLSQAAAPALRQSEGAIVNITDIHAERPLKGYTVYCAAKAGLLGLTRALAVDLAPEVRVNAVAPGVIDWPTDASNFPPARRSTIVANTLLKRVGTPADIARAVVFLIFDAPYITGQVLNVDGGRTAHLSS